MKIKELVHEKTELDDSCEWCKETPLDVGSVTPYGAVIVYKIGDFDSGWFATLSPKTGGDPKKDFTLQLMTFRHLTHFSQIDHYPKLAQNYGIAFAKLNVALTEVMANDCGDFSSSAKTREEGTSVATYGKCTNWKEKKEHLHIKLFPFKRAIGQPYTVDSTFGRKEVFEKDGQEFVKMDPVRKVMIPKERFEYLSRLLISLLNGGKND